MVSPRAPYHGDFVKLLMILTPQLLRPLYQLQSYSLYTHPSQAVPIDGVGLVH